MSSTFKYLDSDQATASSDDAAQSFLNEKLSKNKYTQQQQNTLDTNGGSSVATDTKFNKVVSNQDEIDAFNNTKQPTGGKLSAEQIRDKFGFTYNEDHAKGSAQSKYGGADNGAIYSKDTGEYIGTIANFSPKEQKSGKDEAAKGIDKFKAVQSYGIEQGFRGKERSNWNTMNDVAGAVNDIYGKAEATQEAEAPKPVYKDVPIEHSPEINQAKERVASYENDILSGKVSDDIYGNGDYSFDATKGAAGIGSSSINSSNSQTETAAASFLDKKKYDLKANKQFVPS